MKNSFKMIPILAGIALAAIGSVNKAEAANSSNEKNASSYFGECVGGMSSICNFSPHGTIVYGRWTED